MTWMTDFLVKYPELTVFLAIGLGYLIGQIPFGSFKLGPVTGSLFAGLLIGQVVEVPVSPMTKSFLFLLFLFGIGYSVGPQFLRTLRKDGLKPVVLAIVVTSTGLLTAIAIAKLLDLDAGFAAGLLSGALTESPAMGTATEAINALALPAEQRAQMVSHIAVANAVCYVFGALGAIWFCSVGGPKLLGIDVVKASRELEIEMGLEHQMPGFADAWRPFEMRAYALSEQAAAVGHSVAELELKGRQLRGFVQRLRRDGQIMVPSAQEVLRVGDVVAVSAPRKILVDVLGHGYEEVEDRELLDIAVAVFDVLLTRKDYDGWTLGQMAEEPWVRSLYVRKISRGGQEIPMAKKTLLLRGDVLRLIGPEGVVENAAKEIGAIVRPSEATDFVVLGLAIFLGGLVGVLLHFNIGGLEISLSSSVGTLLAGLTVGHLRARHPLFGRIPDGAVTLMTALGLAAFVAMTGLHAGPVFISAFRQVGLGLFFGGLVVTLFPLVVGLLVGRYILRMNPMLLLGGLAGSQTMTAGLAALQERSGSSVAVLGYTGTVAIGHVLLTTWGTVIVGVIGT